MLGRMTNGESKLAYVENWKVLEGGGLQQNDLQGGIKGWCGLQRKGAIILWNNGL